MPSVDRLVPTEPIMAVNRSRMGDLSSLGTRKSVRQPRTGVPALAIEQVGRDPAPAGFDHRLSAGDQCGDPPSVDRPAQAADMGMQRHGAASHAFAAGFSAMLTGRIQAVHLLASRGTDESRRMLADLALGLGSTVRPVR